MIKATVYTIRNAKRYEEDVEFQVCPRVGELIYRVAGQSILRVEEVMHEPQAKIRIRCQ